MILRRTDDLLEWYTVSYGDIFGCFFILLHFSLPSLHELSDNSYALFRLRKSFEILQTFLNHQNRPFHPRPMIGVVRICSSLVVSKNRPRAFELFQSDLYPPSDFLFFGVAGFKTAFGHILWDSPLPRFKRLRNAPFPCLYRMMFCSLERRKREATTIGILDGRPSRSSVRIHVAMSCLQGLVSPAGWW